MSRKSPQRFNRRFGNVDEVVELLESLPRVRTGDGYTERDRAADFLAVFSAQSSGEQGRRVLSQIAEICDRPSIMADADKPGTLAFKAGMRRVLNEIQRCFVVRDDPVIERTSDGSGNDSS